MTLDLAITLCKGGFVPGDECLADPNVLEPVPETKVIVKDIVTTTRPLRFGRVSQPVVPRPDALRRLHIRFANSRNEIQRELLVICPTMHGFMQLRNSGYERRGGWDPEGRRPMFHTAIEVYEPLAGDIVAEQDDGDGAKVIDYEGSDVVHIGEPV